MLSVEYIPETFKTDGNLQILEQYKINMILVDIILCGTGGTFWISDFKNELVEHVTFADSLLHVNKKINVWTCDLALASSGELVLSTLDDSLRLIQQKSEKVKESNICVFPLVTTCLHISKDYKIIVGVRENGSVDPEREHRKIIVLDTSGKQEMVYDLDCNNLHIFKMPLKLTTHKRNNIYVFDSLSEYRERNVVLGREGGVVAIYDGHNGINDRDHPFTPRDLVTTELCNIIVLDEENHMLHILDNTG